MDRKPLLNIKSLKEQVYEYLREQMHRGQILPATAFSRLCRNRIAFAIVFAIADIINVATIAFHRHPGECEK